MMYFCYHTFEAGQHPKFLQSAIDILMQAEGKAFRDSNDVEILLIKAREALKNSMPKGKTSHIDYHATDEGDITIHIHAADNSDNGVARAYFKPIREFATFSTDTNEWEKLQIKLLN